MVINVKGRSNKYIGYDNECGGVVKYIFSTLYLYEMEEAFCSNTFIFSRTTTGDFILFPTITSVNDRDSTMVVILNNKGLVDIVLPNDVHGDISLVEPDSVKELYEYLTKVESIVLKGYEAARTIKFVQRAADDKYNYYSLFDKIKLWFSTRVKIRRLYKDFNNSFDGGYADINNRYIMDDLHITKTLYNINLINRV